MSEFFPDVPKIAYGGPQSRNPLEFRHYNPDEVVGGKTLKEHLRFSVVYWHTFSNPLSDPFGVGHGVRPWDDGSDSVANAQRKRPRRLRVLREARRPLLCFHDRDVAPEGKTLKESQREPRRGRQGPEGRAGAHRRQAALGHGQPVLATPATCTARPPARNADVFAYAAAQVKKALEVTHELGGAGYVFWGGREGYSTLLNTDMKRELDHLARFLHMAVDYKKQIGFTGTFYIEPKPKEPTKHQYDSDAAACLNFLRTYDLLPHFKLNIETNHATLAGHTMMHELEVAVGARALGSIDANTRRPAAGLGHRPVPDRHLPDDAVHARASCGRGASPPAASTSTPRSAARASSRSTCSTPTSAAWTPSPAA